MVRRAIGPFETPQALRVGAVALGMFFGAPGSAMSAADGWEPAARVGVAFGPSVLPTAETLKGVDVAIDLYRRPECYWVADARAPGTAGLEAARSQADALRAALIERDMPPERVIAWAHIDTAHPKGAIELQIHCSPPAGVSLMFARTSAEISEDIGLWLDVLTASLPARDKTLVIRGYAAPDEQENPLKLALARSLILRHVLVERGFPGRLIQSEADTRTVTDDTPDNAEIVLSAPGQ